MRICKHQMCKKIMKHLRLGYVMSTFQICCSLYILYLFYMRPKMQFSNPFLCKKLLSFSFVLHNSLCAHFKSGNDYKSPCQRNAHIDLWFWEKSKQNHQVLRTEKLDATTSKLVKLFLLRKYLQRPNLKFTHPASRGTKLHH